jgi:beta-aspartyl-peptidase (threonine type)
MPLPRLFVILLGCMTAATASPPPTLVIHGGAGVILRADMSPGLESEYRAALQAALDAGYAVLDAGGTALDAVTTVVVLLEDCPLFNAGRGAVLNAEGACELDAAIMDGRDRAAGAVTGVRHIRNPVRLARDVMEQSPHVMLTGEGAERFAATLGHATVPNDYFITERRRAQWERARELEARQQDTTFLEEKVRLDGPDERKFGTVGAVALDRHGNLAAATSTGGMTNKKYGRVGDSPVIGAGTYADNRTCAVSATGHGEFFIRAVVAHDIAARMAHRGETLAEAAAAVIAGVDELGGTGGVIAVDARGHIDLPFNTPGMYRAWRKSTGESAVEIFGAGDR